MSAAVLLDRISLSNVIIEQLAFDEPLGAYIEYKSTSLICDKLTELVLSDVGILSSFFDGEVAFLPDGYFFIPVVFCHGGSPPVFKTDI